MWKWDWLKNHIVSENIVKIYFTYIDINELLIKIKSFHCFQI